MNKSCENCNFNVDGVNFELKRCKLCSRTDRSLFEEIPNAAIIMQRLMKLGTYPSLKNIKNRVQMIQKTMREQLSSSDEKRPSD
ncbi:hypothetical protein ACFFIX_19430 [Metabacillus herbersteinensis]|uniref:Uncharacterized protein n=1 Tax=Metabacillus herbersteinensis TaxID=283816 RepID=A0ABV6GIP4_9BACI